MTPYTDFLGRCPKCNGYDTRIRSEVVNYDPAKSSSGDPKNIASASRVYVCNSCKHSWTERSGDDNGK